MLTPSDSRMQLSAICHRNLDCWVPTRLKRLLSMVNKNNNNNDEMKKRDVQKIFLGLPQFLFFVFFCFCGLALNLWLKKYK